MMFSLIICSRSSTIDSSLCQNIKSTIGCDFEMVIIDNSQNKYSIFSAYNEGVKRSHGDILCFMHEDIHFHTNNWGNICQSYFQNPEVGMIGVAGSFLQPFRADWRFISDTCIANVAQGYYTLEKNRSYCCEHRRKHCSCFQNRIVQVALVDGLWFCIPKHLFRQVRFDEETFQSFHLYDSDMSMQINSINKKVCVCADILIEHRSEGFFDDSFKESLYKFSEKWKNSLPLVRGQHYTSDFISEKTASAEVNLEARIVLDRMRHTILQMNSSEGSLVLTDEQRLLVNNSLCWHIKMLIKSHEPIKLIIQELISFCGKPTIGCTMKIKMMGKFIWYSVKKLFDN